MSKRSLRGLYSILLVVILILSYFTPGVHLIDTTYASCTGLPNCYFNDLTSYVSTDWNEFDVDNLHPNWGTLPGGGGVVAQTNKRTPACDTICQESINYNLGSFLQIKSIRNWVSYDTQLRIYLQGIDPYQTAIGFLFLFSNTSNYYKILYNNAADGNGGGGVCDNNKFKIVQYYNGRANSLTNWGNDENLETSNLFLTASLRQNSLTFYIDDTKNTQQHSLTLSNRGLGAPGLWACDQTYFSSILVVDYDECATNTHSCDITKSTCTNTAGDYTCNCITGYQGGGNGGLTTPPACVDINECIKVPSVCNTTNSKCMNTVGSFYCSCLPGWRNTAMAYGGNSPCVDLDECLYKGCNSTVANCTQTIGNKNQTRSCICPPGYSGTAYNISISLNFQGCVDINECVLYGCTGATCSQPVPNKRQCTCPAGYNGTIVLTGSASFPGCTDINECLIYGCPFATQQLNCSQLTINTRTCYCPVGYNGTVTLNGSAPFLGCMDINECALYGCGANSRCAEGVPDSRNCSCLAGYAVNGSSPFNTSLLLWGSSTFSGCADIDECAVYGCLNNSVCTTPLPNYRNCTCPAGQFGSIMLQGNAPHQGCVGIDYCFQNGYCNNVSNAKCNTIGINQRLCTCDVGYAPPTTVLTGNTVFGGCTDIDECALYGCDDGIANCSVSSVVNLRTCTCPPGYTGTANITGSNQFAGCEDISECSLYGCNTTVITSCTELQINQRTCQCPPGYNGTTTLIGNHPFLGCTDIDECLLYGCDTTKIAICLNADPNTRTCTCPAGYNGTETLIGASPFMGCSDIDECTVYDCDDPVATCQSSAVINTYQCVCPEGYNGTANLTGNEQFKGCSEIDECTLYGCDNISSCSDSINSRTCTCNPGYNGSAVLNGTTPFIGCKEIDQCATYNCSSDHWATCVPGHPNQRTCLCPQGTTGTALITDGLPFSGCFDIDECYLCGCDAIAFCTTPVLNARYCECPMGYVGSANLIGNQTFSGCVDINECTEFGCGHSSNPGNCTQGPINTRMCSCSGIFSNYSETLIGNSSFSGCCVPSMNVLCAGTGSIPTNGLVVSSAVTIYGSSQINNLVMKTGGNLTVLGDLALGGHTILSATTTVFVQGCINFNGTLNITADKNITLGVDYDIIQYKHLCKNNTFSDANIVGTEPCIVGSVDKNPQKLVVRFNRDTSCNSPNFPLTLVIGASVGGAMLIIVIIAIVIIVTPGLKDKVFPHRKFYKQRKYTNTKTLVQKQLTVLE